jgi:hypothetical protein
MPIGIWSTLKWYLKKPFTILKKFGCPRHLAVVVSGRWRKPGLRSRGRLPPAPAWQLGGVGGSAPHPTCGQDSRNTSPRQYMAVSRGKRRVRCTLRPRTKGGRAWHGLPCWDAAFCLHGCPLPLAPCHLMGRMDFAGHTPPWAPGLRLR